MARGGDGLCRVVCGERRGQRLPTRQKKLGTSGGACLPTLECFIITCDGPAAVATGGGAPFQWSILLGETTDDVAGIGTVPEISASCSSQIRSPKILSKSSDSGWSHAPRPLHSYYRLPRFVVLRTIDGDVESEPIAYRQRQGGLGIAAWPKNAS
jgi:hypothetical protein